MRVHHLNCATMYPILPRLMHGKVPPELQKMVSHCLLIEGADGLVLIDSGFGQADVHKGRISASFRWAARPVLLDEETALRQIEGLGFKGSDVRHIICTHLDLDHAGGLSDFPHAKVHVLDTEHAAAMNPTLVEKTRYRPAQWAHGVDWITHQAQGEGWFGFEAVRDLPGIPPEILMIPLLGHTRGHIAVAVDGPDGWLLHAGDAYYVRNSVDPSLGRIPIGTRIFESLTRTDAKRLVANQHRLTTLIAEEKVTVFCAHDAGEFAACCEDT